MADKHTTNDKCSVQAEPGCGSYMNGDKQGTQPEHYAFSSRRVQNWPVQSNVTDGLASTPGDVNTRNEYYAQRAAANIAQFNHTFYRSNS